MSKNSKNDPIGRNALNTTPMQDDGNESAHLPAAIDAINGILVDASTESSKSDLGYAPLPNEDQRGKLRVRYKR